MQGTTLGGGPADGGEVSCVVSGSNQWHAQILNPHARGPVTAACKHLGVERAACQTVYGPMVACIYGVAGVKNQALENICNTLKYMDLFCTGRSAC